MTPEEKQAVEKAAEEAIENKRQAVNMAAALSGQLITAALGMIALQGAYVAFAADKKECHWDFWSLMLAAFLVFVVSIFCAGKGTAKLYKKGVEGVWNPDLGKCLFKAQAGLCLLGIVFFIWAVFLGRKDKPSEPNPTQKQLEVVIQGLEKQIVINQQIFSLLQTNQSQKVVQKPTRTKPR
jgi:hypothetical protein